MCSNNSQTDQKFLKISSKDCSWSYHYSWSEVGIKLVKCEKKVSPKSLTPGTYTQALICMLLCGMKFTMTVYTCHRRKSLLFFNNARSRGSEWINYVDASWSTAPRVEEVTSKTRTDKTTFFYCIFYSIFRFLSRTGFPLTRKSF